MMRSQNKIIFLTSLVCSAAMPAHADIAWIFYPAALTSAVTGWKLKNRLKAAYQVANEAHKVASQKAKKANENPDTQNDVIIKDLTRLEFMLSKEFPRKATAITLAVNGFLWWWFYKDQVYFAERQRAWDALTPEQQAAKKAQDDEVDRNLRAGLRDLCAKIYQDWNRPKEPQKPWPGI